MATFLPDGVWEVPARNIRLQGHAEIRAASTGFVARMAYYI